jgi:hypothetical protein
MIVYITLGNYISFIKASCTFFYVSSQNFIALCISSKALHDITQSSTLET